MPSLSTHLGPLDALPIHMIDSSLALACPGTTPLLSSLSPSLPPFLPASLPLSPWARRLFASRFNTSFLLAASILCHWPLPPFLSISPCLFLSLSPPPPHPCVFLCICVFACLPGSLPSSPTPSSLPSPPSLPPSLNHLPPPTHLKEAFVLKQVSVDRRWEQPGVEASVKEKKILFHNFPFASRQSRTIALSTWTGGGIG